MFSDADVKSIFRNITVHGTQLLQPPPYIDLVSGGLVLEHHVKERIKNAILSQHHETGGVTFPKEGQSNAADSD